MFFILKKDNQFEHNNPIMFEFMRHVFNGDIIQKFLDELSEKKNYLQKYHFEGGFVFYYNQRRGICTFGRKGFDGILFECLLDELRLLLGHIDQFLSNDNMLLIFDGYSFAVCPLARFKEKIAWYRDARIYTRFYLKEGFCVNENDYYISMFFDLLYNTICVKELLFEDKGGKLEWGEKDVGKSFYCNDFGFEILKDSMIDVKYDGGATGFVVHKEAYLACVHDWEGYEKRSDVDDVKLITIVVKGTYGKVTFKTSQELGL